jgi:iron complex outermembrane receptor protein
MRLPISMMLATASALAVATGSAAAAQPAPPAASAPAAESATLGEIVVTARRRAESLQEVPQVVNAITSDTLTKLNIQEFQDIQALAPGLTLQSNQTGYQETASLRGVTFDVNTGAQPTVAMYMNDAPVGAGFVFKSLFDVGQIEVLRGPQGTTRGISAPSGAITLTTHKPNLSEFGGYFDGSLTDLQGRNVQGAINVPIIKDVLAVRAAAVIDQNDFDGVRSIHNNLRPDQKTGAERVSLSFEPSDRFNANVAYQHLDHTITSFTQVMGPGDGTAINPPITAAQRASVQDGAHLVSEHQDLVTAQLDSRIFGQHLSYVGSYQHSHLTSVAPEDTGNILPGIEIDQNLSQGSRTTTQEIRLASDPAPGRFFDYTVGGFYQWQDGSSFVTQPGVLYQGAFGPPPTFNPALYNPAYLAHVFVNVPTSYQETSLFGSVTFHLGANTELTGGIRHIASIARGDANLTLGPGLIAFPLRPSCNGNYPGFCDIHLGSSTIQNLTNRTSARPNIYNVSLSHHITRDLLVYANTGTSFRPGPTAIGLKNPTNNPILNSLIFLQPETSRAYEVGFKSTFLDGRARVNLALWRQHFHNLFVFTPSVPYLSSTDGKTFSVSTFSMTSNADATVSGVDLDSAFQITNDWNVSFQYSYAHGNIDSTSKVPCNDSDFDGVADNGAVTQVSQFPPGQIIAFCHGGTVSRNPVWNASLQSEYVHPITDGLGGFVRGLWTYYPENKYAEPGFTVPGYGLMDLYLGVRSRDGAWEASLFARNAFGDNTLLDRSTQTLQLPGGNTFYPTHSISKYTQVTGYTARREVGVHVRYAWGSR